MTDSLLDVLKHTHSAVVKADLRWQTTLSMYKFDTFQDEILSVKRRFESILGKEFKKLQMARRSSQSTSCAAAEASSLRCQAASASP